MNNVRKAYIMTVIFMLLLWLAVPARVFSAVPASPTLKSPPHGSTVNGKSITFAWDAAVGATKYWLYVCVDYYFSGCPNAVYSGALTSYTMDAPDNGVTYWWRVMASNNEGGTYSWMTWSVKNGPTSAPNTPIPLSPTNGATVSGGLVEYSWTPADRAMTYVLQIAYDNAFNYIYKGISPLYTNTTLVQMPDDGLTYYWRVQANNSKGTTTSTTYWLKNAASAVPEAPTLVYPPSGVTVHDLDMYFEWEPAYRASDYYLQIASDVNFSIIVYDDWVGDEWPYLGLDPVVWRNGLFIDGRKYYWRVRGENGKGLGPYSAFRTFTYDDELVPCTSTYSTSGTGVLGNHYDHIDVCSKVDSYGDTIYILSDMSRRFTQNGHKHTGGMTSTASIKTKQFYWGYPYLDENVWTHEFDRPGVDAHVYAGQVYDYLYDSSKGWSLNSYDGSGNSMESVVELLCVNNNWNPCLNAYFFDYRVYFSEGYAGQAPYTGASDVSAHEWGHGVTEWASTIRGRGAELDYHDQSGALNEAFSDWMAASFDNFKGDVEVQWTVGEDISAIRSISDPPLYSSRCENEVLPDIKPQPDHMSGYITCRYGEYGDDNGGVHFNSGIPNKMFYLLSEGGTHHDVNVQGVGIIAAIKIAKRANLEAWTEFASFIDARDGMFDMANDTYPSDPNIGYQVNKAWLAVGVGTQPIITTGVNIASGGTTSGGGSFDWGDIVTVTATPNTGYIFQNWTEGGIEKSKSTAYSFTVNGNKTLKANFTSSTTLATLTVNKSGLGADKGKVIGTGINCGADCSENYTKGPTSTVTLTVSIDPGAVFTGWTVGSGTCIGTVSPCTVTMDSNKSVTASFELSANIHTLTVLKPAGGGGVVTSSPIASINCGPTCSASFSGSVTLTATHDNYSYFGGWNDETGCESSITCDVAMDVDKTVSAFFYPLWLTVDLRGEGSGLVTSDISGISCDSMGLDCSELYTFNQYVTLTATPAAGSIVESWSGGGCSGNGNTCRVQMNQAHLIWVKFKKNTLTVKTTDGTGWGNVKSGELPTALINCGNGGMSCSHAYDLNTTVTLTAQESSNSKFVGWSVGAGTCINMNNPCQVTMNGATTVSAKFMIYGLGVNKVGNGNCVVVSSPAGINCDTGIALLKGCGATFPLNTNVSLSKPTCDSVSVFKGWSGSGCTGKEGCVVAITGSHAVTAQTNQLYFEETDPDITYTGTWSPYTCATGAGCSGGAIKLSNIPTVAAASLTFTGSAVR